jgi:anti-sigma-K factor RskA
MMKLPRQRQISAAAREHLAATCAVDIRLRIRSTARRHARSGSGSTIRHQGYNEKNWWRKTIAAVAGRWKREKRVVACVVVHLSS